MPSGTGATIGAGSRKISCRLVLIGGGRTIVVDTGFDRTAGAQRDRELVLPVEEGLKALGVRPDAVEDVIITHMHWDHAGNHDPFPQARYHVLLHGPLHLPSVYPATLDDVTAMVRRVYAGNVR